MTAASNDVTADEVRSAVFPKPPFGRRGYDEKSVNDLLQLAARRLDGRGHLRAADMTAVVFRTAPLTARGYDKVAVDAFMARVIAAVAAMESTTVD